MARTTTVSLRDGPLAGQSFQVPEHLCAATLLLDGPTWIIEHEDGSSTLGTGPVDPEATIYSRLEYAVSTLSPDGRRVYAHQRTVQVLRCRATKGGNRCRNEAEERRHLCTACARAARDRETDGLP